MPANAILHKNLSDARILVDIHKQRLLVIPLAICDQIALVWVIDNLTSEDSRRELVLGEPIVRNVIRAALEPLTEADRAALGGYCG